MIRPSTAIVMLILLPVFDRHVRSQESERRDARQPSEQGLLDLFEAREFQGMPYRLMRPIDLADDPEMEYPIVLSLHGGAGRGTDNQRNLFRQWNQVLAEPELRRKHPAFVVAPQSTLPWIAPGSVPKITKEGVQDAEPMFRQRLKELAPNQKMLNQGLLFKVFDLLDALTEEFNVDTDRIYVLGHSMGGAGTWNCNGSA